VGYIFIYLFYFIFSIWAVTILWFSSFPFVKYSITLK
jgi:hypothetical protein